MDAERNRLKIEIRDNSMKFEEIDCTNVANKRMLMSVAISRSVVRLTLINSLLSEVLDSLSLVRLILGWWWLNHSGPDGYSLIFKDYSYLPFTLQKYQK